MKKRRLDELVFESGLATDPERARALIMAGEIRVVLPSGEVRRGQKAGELVVPSAEVTRFGERPKYVSRAGQKLEACLDRFSIEACDRACADIGISTGGFTDCLLQRGARVVHGVDVAYGQVAWSIRTHPRLVLHERTNARTLAPGFFGEPIELMVVDVSFIGLASLLGGLVPHLAQEARLVVLVKPQFELPREAVGSGGLVSDEASRREALGLVQGAAQRLGLRELGFIDSPIAGADGNRELLLALATR